MGCAGCKFISRKSLEVVLTLEVIEQCLHLLRNMLRIAKGTPSLAYAYSAKLPSPGVHILKEMVVDGAVMGGIKVPMRQRLIRALRSHCRLKFIECVLTADTRYILEDRSSFVAIQVDYRIVHIPRLACVLLGNLLATVFVGKTLLIKSLEIFVHFLGQMNT